MKINYDPTTDALGVQLWSPRLARGSITTQVVAPGVHLDFTSDGKLVALELLDASAHVPAAVLAALPDAATWLSLVEAGKESGLDPGTLRVQLNKGRIKGKKIGRDWFIARHELFNYLDSRAPQGRPAAKKKARRARPTPAGRVV